MYNIRSNPCIGYLSFTVMRVYIDWIIVLEMIKGQNLIINVSTVMHIHV